MDVTAGTERGTDRAAWLQSQRDDSGFTSVDPAPPQAAGDGLGGGDRDGRRDGHGGADGPAATDVAALRARLLDGDAPMFQRMRAVFALRNVGGDTAIDALAAAFADPSALLRHELAYVMGQMGDAHAVPVLVRVLAAADEHVMVRHEAAEALGAIGDEAARPVLERFLHDPHPEVAESCEVALDLLDWMRGDELERAA